MKFFYTFSQNVLRAPFQPDAIVGVRRSRARAALPLYEPHHLAQLSKRQKYF